MNPCEVHGRFLSALLVPGEGSEWTDVAVVEITDESVVISDVSGKLSIKLCTAGALEIAEFILRNASE